MFPDLRSKRKLVDRPLRRAMLNKSGFAAATFNIEVRAGLALGLLDPPTKSRGIMQPRGFESNDVVDLSPRLPRAQPRGFRRGRYSKPSPFDRPEAGRSRSCPHRQRCAQPCP